MKKRTVLPLILLLITALIGAVPGISARAENYIPEQSDLETRVRLSSIEVYDKETDRFIFDVGGAKVTMNIPTGIVTKDAVQVSIPAGLTVKLYKDGNQLIRPDFSNISEPGGYILLLGNSGEVSLDFTIVGTYSGNMGQYNMPAGFSVIEAKLNGMPFSTAETVVDMRQEGKYTIDYGCSYIGKTYHLEVEADYTAPVLTFTGLENNYAEGPVEIFCAEPGCTITLTQDGKAVEFRSPLKSAGNYSVTVKDPAGNSNIYLFTIGLYFTLNHFTVFLILAAMILALAVYMWISRKRLRIR